MRPRGMITIPYIREETEWVEGAASLVATGRRVRRARVARRRGLYELEESPDVERLRQEVVGSGGEELAHPTPGRVGGDHHDRRVLRDRILAKAAEHLFSRHVGQVK